MSKLRGKQKQKHRKATEAARHAKRPSPAPRKAAPEMGVIGQALAAAFAAAKVRDQ